jgi:ClpP class serine protease
MNLFSLACSVPWLITEDAFRTVLEIASREDLDPELARQIREERESRPSAVAARASRPLDGAERVSIRDGVAMVPVIGPIVRRGGFFSDVSGASSITRLATDFNTALNDPQVKAILLVVDSPGGEANGVNEFAQMIYDARGQKPIVAYVEGLGASAAYWLASACDEIVCDAIAVIGSIGAVRTVPNPKQESARTIEIVSSQSPNKRPDVATEKGRAQIQAQVDALADVFVAAVARNRGVSVETVLADFGQGGLFVGQAAIVAGLADRIGSFEATLSDLAQRTQPSSLYGRPRGTAAEEPMDWKKVFSGMFAAAAEVEQAQAATEPAAAVASEPAPAAADVSAAQAELEQLKAQLAARESVEAKAAADALAASATAFATAQIDANLALPADADALAAVYTACATAGCAEQLTTLFAARPAHQVTTEVLPAGNHEALEADRGQGDAAAQRAAAEKLMAQTPLGQAALKRRGA